jgi:hypothetical protein
MSLRYRIVFTWPDGKVRYCAQGSNTPDIDKAHPYTLVEARDIVRNKYKDARLIWGIITTKERINDPNKRSPRKRARR